MLGFRRAGGGFLSAGLGLLLLALGACTSELMDASLEPGPDSSVGNRKADTAPRGMSRASSKQSTSPGPDDEEDTAWYNWGVFHWWFGDFPKVTERVTVDSPQEAAELVERGQYLVKSVADCARCHATDKAESKKKTSKKNKNAIFNDYISGVDQALAGGRLFEDSFGQLRAANITADPLTGIGRWTILEIMRALRASIDKEGRPLSIDSHSGYRWLSDRDAKAIALYILQQPPVRNEVERRRLGGIERNRFGVVPVHSEVKGYVPALPATETAGYGRYLARNVARCDSCHENLKIRPQKIRPESSSGAIEGFSNQSEKMDPPQFPNLDRSGYLAHLSSPAKGDCPTDKYKRMSMSDRRAIAAYLAITNSIKREETPGDDNHQAENQ